jgi:tripartite motif-containing protein 71
MRFWGRTLAAGLICGLLGLSGWSTVALAGEASSRNGVSSLSGNPFVVPGEEALVGSQVAEAEAVRRASPEAVAARGVSSSAYEGLWSGDAQKVTDEAFSGLVSEPAGGPQLPVGQKILSYLSTTAASLELPGGLHGVLSSQAPIAVEVSAGKRVPVDLSLTEVGGRFQAKAPAAGVQVDIPKRLADGPSLKVSGVGLTPVDEQGSALGGAEGVVDGASVFYGDTEAPGVSDVDTVVKPDTLGLSTETILRSQRSPGRLFFRVSLPEGASLVAEPSGAVNVVEWGRVISVILPSSARDAEGTVVPVAMSVSGDMLELKVEHRPGQYLMPIEVDPTIVESQTMSRYQMGDDWWFSPGGSSGAFTDYQSYTGTDGMEDHNYLGKKYVAGEYGLFGQETEGESRIYEFVSESYNKIEPSISSVVYIGGKAGVEGPAQSAGSNTVCVAEKCAATLGGSSNWANGAFYKQSALAEGADLFEAMLKSASVYIVQEKGPTIRNMGSCGATWTKTGGCSLTVNATDPGIGVYEYTFSSTSAPAWGEENQPANCKGVQCPECLGGECVPSTETPNIPLTGLPEGEVPVSVSVKDATGLTASLGGAVKIDNAAPHNIALSGLPSKNEIGAGEYRLKIEATDGITGTASSGVKSISLLIDGRSVGAPSGSCSSGPCTAHGEWAIFGREYGTGRHTITAIATDNAGNTAQETFSMVVHAPTPVAVGPGQVNPQSGEFALSATDVSMGGGLSFSRSYRSRHLMLGAEGPISAQWGLSLGGQETLVKQPDGSMLLTEGSGAQTSFSSDGKGGFLSPAGDANLTLSSTPCKVGGSEYMLRDTAAATTTCFAVPSGGSGEVWTPSISEGPVATDTVTYAYKTVKSAEYSVPSKSYPEQIASGPDGNLWFTDHETDRVGKITTSGAVTEYSLPSGSRPMGITAGPDGNVWFTDVSTNRIGKITTTGTLTEYSLPSESWPYEIIKGPDGNLWFTEGGTHKIGKITTSGSITEYALPAGKSPEGITVGPDGDLWFTEESASEIGKITTSGTATEYSLPERDYPRNIAAGPDGNLWFTEEGPDKIGKITTSGTLTEYATKSETTGIVKGQDGNMWFTSWRMGQVGKITTTGTVTEYSVPSESEPYGITTGPDGNIWYTDLVTNKIGMMLTLGALTEPTEALAPVPAGVSCSPELKAGCRALSFNYASSTTATGENSSEWGDYDGHLTRVYYTAYDPVSKAMKTVEVAHYLYDKQARLRAEWDPRISPALKSTYGYDGEGHVTALTMPGQESWAFSYGTIAGDTGAGRLLKSTQAPASALLWSGEGVKNTEVPKLSGSALTGTRMTVSDGVWTASPVLYGYQWDDCNSSGKECVAIPGATNANYTPVTSDEGHTLLAQVTATNGDGSLNASSAASALVKSGHGEEGAARSPQPGTTIEYGVALSGTGLPTLTKSEVEKWAQKDFPTEATAIFPPDEPQTWPASDYKRATIYYRDSTSRTVNLATPGGGISTSEYNEQNDVIRSLSADNHATALKEGAKSAEVSQTLDTQSTYSPEGTELLSTLGPQHTVKLAAGSEVQARSHTMYSYDEGSPSEDGPFRLVTKMTQGAQVTGKEEDVRTTRTYYSGQKGLGWKLRKPTSVVTDPAGLDLAHTTIYNETTGAVTETKTPGGTSETVYPPAYTGVIGSEGSGKGQFNHPVAAALDSSGDLWVDDKNNGRLEKFTATGGFIAEYGSTGTGNDQFSNAWAMAIAQSSGNVYVADTGNNRMEELNSAGAFVRTFGTEGTGRLNEPDGVAIDASGDVWVSDYVNNRLVEFSASGEFMKEVGATGTGNGQFKGPEGISISEGSLFVVDHGNSRIEQFSLAGGYMNQFGKKGSGPGEFNEPFAIATNPTSGNLYISDLGNHRMQEFSPAGKLLSYWETWSKPHAVSYPTGLAIAPSGELYIADEYGNQVSEWVLPEAGSTRVSYTSQFGSSGTGEGQFREPYFSTIDGYSNLWVTDNDNSRIEEFSASGKFVAAYGSEGVGNGQLKYPTGIGVNQGTGNVYVSDSGNNRIEEFSSSGAFVRTFGTSESGKLNNPMGLKIDSSGNVWVADKGNNRVVEFSSTGSFIAAYGSEGSGSGQFKGPTDIAFSGSNLYVTDLRNDRVQELSSAGSYIRQFGIEGSGSGEFYGPTGIAADSSGNLYVTDNGDGRVEEFSATGAFRASIASEGSEEGQLSSPTGISINAAGDIYVVDSRNNRVEQWTPINQAAHDTKTIYYTAKTEAEAVACQNHPEWAMLPCLSEPAAQPERGLPPLPLTTTTYNMYQEPLVSSSTSGSSTRTTTNAYDEAGRLFTSETTASTGTALPKVTDKYSETTGALTEQSTSSESIKSVFNRLGELTSYTDADGNTSTFEYETEKDARLKEINDGKGTQTLIYDGTTGLVKELFDSSTGFFTAGYDVEGNLTSEGYPNGMTAKYTINAAGERVGLVYKKETHCTEKCEWYVDNIVPSIHGQWLAQTSSLGKEAYTYDAAGRLTESQATPTGTGGCMTRRYAYDEDTNRTSLTTYQPNSKGECATETGTVERHTYDEADRLLDPGTSYNAFGDTTSLPAADAGGSELTSSFYVDNQLASQTQAGETIGYNLDPAGRTREIVSTGKIVASEIQHYAGPGDTPAWTGETSGNWTRKISTMSGLSAIQHNGEKAILQLTNLHGDIIATAQNSETSTGLASTIKEASDYGVPATETPPKYSWLGAHEIPTELSSGVTEMGARSYVPQLGRFLQTDPRPGDSANAYAYTYGDPINSNDLTGEFSTGPSAWALGLASQLSNEETAAYEAALRAEAERKAREAAEAARAYAAMQGASPEGEYYEEEGPEEENWEEEGGEEYAAFGPGPGSKSSAHAPQPTQMAEGGVFFQALSGEEGGSIEGRTISRSMIHLCEQDLGRKVCVSYVGFFDWLKKEVKSKWHSLEKAAKSTWKAIKASVIKTFHTLGYGDLVCYEDGCLGAVATIYDGYTCIEEQDCQAFSQDMSEYL